MNIKSTPLIELAVTAIVYVYDDGCDGVQEELVITNDASYERYNASSEKIPNRRCSCCGHAIRWASIIEHLPTGTFYAIGRTCAQKISHWTAVNSAFGGATVALSERAAANKREAAFRATASPEALAALDWAKTGVNRTAKDIADKVRKYDVSEKQVAFLVGLHQRDTAYRASLTGGLVAGKQELSGVILSTKAQVAFDRYSKSTTKGLVQLANGCKVWGTVPEGTVKGAEVRFTATVELSEKDPAFGFYKRPTKWQTATVAAA